MALTYSSPTTITISLQSLQTSGAWLIGRESDEIDNTSNKYHDALVQGKVTVGTTPTANTLIVVYVWGSDAALSSGARDVLDGVDSEETFATAGSRDSFLRLAGSALVDATSSDVGYEIGPFSVAAALGLRVLPPFWGIFVTHNTGAALNSTSGNHSFKFTGITL